MGLEKVSILLNDVHGNYKTILRINKQRFKCKTIVKTLAEDLVSDRHQIYHCLLRGRVKQAVLELLSEPFYVLIARMETRFSNNANGYALIVCAVTACPNHFFWTSHYQKCCVLMNSNQWKCLAQA